MTSKKMEAKKEDLHTSELNIDLKPHKVGNEVKCLKKKPTFPAQEARMINNEKASIFKSQIKNPSFLVTIGPAYLHTGRGHVCIPAKFGNVHLREIKEFNLQVLNGNYGWKVKCVNRWYSHIQRFEIGTGWRIFARDNNLKEDRMPIWIKHMISELLLDDVHNIDALM
ncbi:uncharacterized protein LOC120089155 [Benincasa hispida]|uniref:uncharacterized protein LOC120089155 n=1 Tax=Benincasa hispida TaxID=102211 RepID=UPI0018FF6253|nr:uncharacterized protein LOC120089155 [Benincasa hispida]